MKLYDLSDGLKFKLKEPTDCYVAPGSPPVELGTVYKLRNVDGMYSYCTDDEDNVYHIAAYSAIERVVE